MNRLEAMERALESDHCLRPAKAFALISDETRIAILEALWYMDEQPTEFTKLYETAEADNSAQFNYHLNQLTGHFIRKTEDGYKLRTAGESVVQAVVEGSFNAHPNLEPFDTGEKCTRCEASLMAKYDDEKLGIKCSGCGRMHGRYSFPPGGLIERNNHEILSAFNHRVRHLHCLANDGVCSKCSGQMQTEIVHGGDCCLDADLRADYTCEQCRHTLCSPIGLALLGRSRVVAFYRNHDIDLRSIPYWRLNWCVSDDYTTVESSDPWRIEISIVEESDVLRVTLDGDLDVRKMNQNKSVYN